MANSILGNTPAQSDNVMQRFQQFKSSFNGDPRAVIQQMLRSGQINQMQLEQAAQIAQRYQGMNK